MDLPQIAPAENATPNPPDGNTDVGNTMTLDKIGKLQISRVLGFAEGNEDLVARLREIGFAEEDEVELLHTGPLGRKPLCFRLNRTMVALRPDEARAINVELLK